MVRGIDRSSHRHCIGLFEGNLCRWPLCLGRECKDRMVLYSTFLGGLISFTVSVKGGAGGPFGKQNTGRSESFAQLVAFLDGCWLSEVC
jgi:hypothetical protein